MSKQPTPEQIQAARQLTDRESLAMWAVRAVVALAVCAASVLAPWGCTGGVTLP